MHPGNKPVVCMCSVAAKVVRCAPQLTAGLGPTWQAPCVALAVRLFSLACRMRGTRVRSCSNIGHIQATSHPKA
eukprot:6458015-Amphidinium_carterae.1